ncbi:MAG: universal stress protein [Alphaproteobacteria bacterium]
MAIKTVLVHVDHVDGAEARVAAAVGLADRHDAHLIGIGVKPPVNLPVYAEVPLPSDLIASLEARAEQDVATAARRFAAATAGRAGRCEWTVAEGDPTDALALAARYADLTVIGQPNPDGAPADYLNLPDNLVMEAGRPLLVMPFAGVAKPVGDTVVVAWNASRESARALAGALPILEKAGKVHVLTVDPEKIGETQGARISAFLSRHGVKAEIVRTPAADMDVGDILLNSVADRGADLLVMGAYGHSRFREVILGGVSRHVIQNMTVPVLLTH